MRTIGLLGGMSWESTAVYYRRLNENVRDRLGGLRSAKVIMHSVDFESIVELQKADAWDQAGAELATLALFVFSCVVFAAGVVVAQLLISKDPRVTTEEVDGVKEKHITLTHSNAKKDEVERLLKWNPDVVVLQMNDGFAMGRNGLAQSGRQGIDRAALDAGSRQHHIAAGAPAAERKRDVLQRLAFEAITEHVGPTDRKAAIG